MEAVFIKLLNMSIAASRLVLAVVALRLLLKKAPKAITVVMWALVGFRLICPFSFESIFSLIPSAEVIPSDILYSETPALHSGISALNSAVNPIISDYLSPYAGSSVNPVRTITFGACVIWIIGMLAMLLYSAVSYFKIHKKISEAALLNKNIWLCDSISTPFILGLLHPRVYLPSYIDKRDAEYVIAHENAHLKRLDHWWKPLGFLLLTVYWFNPVLWIAYILFCRDIEFACDERVIRKIGLESKKAYSYALINCSAPGKTIAACPLAFGETSVKSRIKSVLSYKKPALWVIIVAVAACIALAFTFLTNPKTEESRADIGNKNPSFSATVLEVYENSVLVEPFEGEEERSSADKIYVNTKDILANSSVELNKGDKILIEYDGYIMETYPAQISKVFSVYLL